MCNAKSGRLMDDLRKVFVFVFVFFFFFDCSYLHIVNTCFNSTDCSVTIIRVKHDVKLCIVSVHYTADAMRRMMS